MALATSLAAPARAPAARGAAAARAPRAAAAGARRVAARAGADPAKVVDSIKAKFEASDNKPVVIGYGVAALAALAVTDKIVNFPVLNLLLPKLIEVVGVVTIALLAFRYVKEGEDAEADIDSVLDKIAPLLPGLKK